MGGDGISVKSVLKVFRHQVARTIAEKTNQSMVGGEWEWSLMEDTLEISGICPIKE